MRSCVKAAAELMQKEAALPLIPAIGAGLKWGGGLLAKHLGSRAALAQAARGIGSRAAGAGRGAASGIAGYARAHPVRAGVIGTLAAAPTATVMADRLGGYSPPTEMPAQAPIPQQAAAAQYFAQPVRPAYAQIQHGFAGLAQNPATMGMRG